jgi:hypothetical protein
MALGFVPTAAGPDVLPNPMHAPDPQPPEPSNAGAGTSSAVTEAAPAWFGREIAPELARAKALHMSAASFSCQRPACSATEVRPALDQRDWRLASTSEHETSRKAP